MKIPMYNKGQGPTVEPAAGSLGPRASIGTFAAPGQAAAQFANQASQIAFQFGMAEKKRETDRVANEESIRIQAEADDFLLNNQDTETAVFTNNFDKFQQKQFRQIDSIKNLTDTQRDEVRARATRLMAGKMAAGKQNTFNRGQQQSSLAANELIQANINEMGTLNSNDPRFIELYNTNVSEIKKGVANGLKINYTETSMKLAADSRNYFNSIQSATSTGELDAIKDRASKDKTLPTKTLQALLGNISAQERVINADNFDAARDGVAQISETTTPDQLDAIASAYLNNEQITINVGGEDVFFDPSVLTSGSRLQMATLVKGFSNTSVNEIADTISGRISEISDNTTKGSLLEASKSALNGENFEIVRSDGTVESFDISQLPKGKAIQLAGVLETFAKNIEDTSSAEMVNGVTEVIGSGASEAGTLEFVQGMYRPELMAQKGLEIDDVDNVIYKSVDQSVDSVARSLTEGDMSNVPEMIRKLDLAEALLTQDLDGRGAFENRVSSLGNSAAGTLDRISAARKEIATQVNAKASLSVGVDTFMNKNFSSVNRKTQEVDNIIAIGMSQAATKARANNQNVLSAQFELLEGNNVTYKPLKEQLGQARAIGESGILEAGTPDFQRVAEAFETYVIMSSYGGVQANHTNEADRTFFDAVQQRLPYETLETAMINVSKAAQLDIEVTVPLKQIEQETANLADSVEQNAFVKLFTDAPTELQNISSVQQKFKDRALDYVRLGIETDAALELAKNDLVKSHVLVRGILTPRTVGLPENINIMADMAVDQALSFRDERRVGVPIINDEDLESADLSIIQATGNPNVWALVRDGGIPVTGVIYKELGAEVPGVTETILDSGNTGLITWTTQELHQLVDDRASELAAARIEEVNSKVKETAASIANGLNIDQSLSGTGGPMYSFGEAYAKEQAGIIAAETEAEKAAQEERMATTAKSPLFNRLGNVTAQ